ncbi:MAG: vWA domain-containing protein, partial [Eubacteriales bacterium]|nr:vWA domain-containing protein [Eubacteriales bacterium]
MKNKIITLCLVCGLSVMQSTVMVAAATSSFLQGYDTEEGQLQFYMASQDYTVAADNLEVTLGGEEVPVALIETTSSVPVTYYCLTDVSGSMRDEQFAQAKEVLQAICDGMSEGDNMVLATLGNNVETTGFLSDSEAVSEAIRALSVGNEDTNLYSGIVESIRLLEENTAVCQRKCLVILSDGKDDQKTGITKSEADNAIMDSRIPVYTVATLRSEQTEEQLADAKILGSFANESAGGIHYAPVLMEGQNGSTVGTDIVTSMKQGLKVTADISGYQAARDLVLLRVIYQNIGNVSVEDTMEVYAQDLKYALPETDPTEQES